MKPTAYFEIFYYKATREENVNPLGAKLNHPELTKTLPYSLQVLTLSADTSISQWEVIKR